MTIAAIATVNPTRSSLTAILCHTGGDPNMLGAFLLSHYTKRSQVRALVRMGYREDNMPHPHDIKDAGRGRPARTGYALAIADWADRHGAQYVYVMGLDSQWRWQRVGPWFHGHPLIDLTSEAIADWHNKGFAI